MTNKSFIFSIIILLVTSAVVVVLTTRGTPSVVRTNLEKIPMNIVGYSAVEDFLSETVYEELNADKHVYRHYFSPAGQQIDLYIGYYGTAKGGRTPHNPYACLPSQGWAIIDTGKILVRTTYAPNGIYINFMVSKNSGLYKYMVHWYQSAATKVLDSGFKQNIQRFLGKILHNRNDGAYIQISKITTEANMEKEKKLISSFAEHVLNLLPGYWPEEQ